MTGRIMGIELRRSGALLVGVLVCAAGWALLSDPERWTGRWMMLILSHRANLWLLWPLAAAGGAWHARRDRAARIEDLLSTTPRPRSSRVAPTATVLAASIGVGYALSLVEPLFRTLRSASYQPSTWLWHSAVGVLSLVAAGLVGLGWGRLMPSRLTPPLVLVLGAAVVVLPQVLWEDTGSRALLLLPDVLVGDEFSAVHWRTDAGQALWFSAVAVGGFVLFAGVGRRAKLLAVLPVALGLAVALVVLPPVERAAIVDPHAAALVCAPGPPRVCVTKVYEPILPQLLGPARTALLALRRLPNAPTAVVQETQVSGLPVTQRRDSVHLELTVDRNGSLMGGPEDVEWAILDGAGTWSCGASDDASRDRLYAARAVAGAWLQGRAQPRPDPWGPTQELTMKAWTTLHSLPADQQLARMVALREAALNCQDGLYQILTAPVA